MCVRAQIPFSFVQFPIFEALKLAVRHRKGGSCDGVHRNGGTRSSCCVAAGRDVNGLEGGLCGSCAGAIAAAVSDAA